MSVSERINLHPSTHPPSSLETHVWDVICLGSGWAARSLASRCVAAGLTALLIEKELIGGDCPFWACIPSKALLRPAEALDSARHVTGARERLADASAPVDPAAVFARRDMYTAGWDDTKIAVPMVEGAGVHVIRGIGRISGVKKVSVTLDTGGDSKDSIDLEARHAVAICTGSEEFRPNIPGLAESRAWGQREAMSSSTVPESLLIMGGGVVGVEMATLYSSLGSKVTLANRGPELLPAVDPEAGAVLRKSLESRGVRVLVSTSVTSVQRKAGDNVVSITLSSAGQTSETTATKVLVAVGRRAVTRNIGLESVGYAAENLEAGGSIKVDESLAVCGDTNTNAGVPWLYAAGDVNGRALLTHISKYHGRISANAIVARARGEFPESTSPFDRFSASSDHSAVPQVIFSDPAVASVGLTRKKAESQGRAVRIVTAPVKTIGAMLHAEGYEDGWAQWVIDKETSVLLGATMVGSEASELIHASTVAIVGKMRLDQLAHAIPCFPTMSEVYLNLIEAAGL